MNSTLLAHIIPPADSLAELDLDEIRLKLEAAAAVWTLDEQRATLYETELQRELRGKVDLCGAIPGCLTPEAAFNLSGLALLAARREAGQKFNQVFYMAPLSRHAQTPTPTVPLPDSPDPPQLLRTARSDNPTLMERAAEEAENLKIENGLCSVVCTHMTGVF